MIAFVRDCMYLQSPQNDSVNFILKNSNLQIFIYKKLCMKSQLNDEKTHVDPWSHHGIFSVRTARLSMYEQK